MALPDKFFSNQRVPQGPAQQTPCNDNVLPFPSRRVLLPVTLAGQSLAVLRTQLKTLLHSPIGVYVVSTQIARDEVRVQFDIASEDVGFTLHALMQSIPQALIGPLSRPARSHKST